MTATRSFKPTVSDTTLETRVVLSTIAPRAAVAVVNTPSYFNPLQNQTNPGNLRAPVRFGAVAHPPFTGGSGFAGSGANSGTGVGRGNGLYI